MKIVLSPQRRDDTLSVIKSGDVLTLNGKAFNFSRMAGGDTLPWSAIESEWFAGDIEKMDEDLTLALLLPNPWNFSPEQAFPLPLLNVPDGEVIFPQPLPTDADPVLPDPPPAPFESSVGVIDWSLLITREMKVSAAQAAHLSEVKAELAAKNAKAVAQIARMQDRIDTISYGIDAGEATEEDEAEQAALLLNLKAWKAYKFALGKVTAKASWPANPEWPAEPVVPVIEASPMARAADSM